jgi:predicted lipoprotein with Yx(FWY)xxD motif
MQTTKQIGSLLVLLAGLLLLATLAGCGSSSSTTAAATATSTTAPSPTPAATVLTRTVSINGTQTTILTSAQGQTLYHFNSDSATTSACTGSCASTWPPLLFTGSGTPTAATSLPHALSVQHTANGQQVEYDKHLLYTYSGDTAPGQTKGQGLFGKWFVVTPSL